MTIAHAQTSETTRNNVSYVVYLGWLSLAIFYFYQYILRVAPGVLVTDLRQTFQLTSEQFSTLGAFYLYAYSFCQIPLGIIVDYVGLRKTVLVSITLCVVGSLMLASAPNLFMVQLSRVIVGIGSACAFMCSLKLIVDYMPVGHRGFLMGATLTLGTLGALAAGKPLALLADQIGWRSSVSIASYLGLVILLVVFLFLPRPRRNILAPVTTHLFKNIGTSILQILKIRPVMIYALLAVGVYTPLSVLADLWGVSFLMQKYELTRVEAAEISMMMYFGLGLGCLIIPWLSEKYTLLNRSIQFCAFGVLGVFALLLYGPSLSHFNLEVALTLLGVFCGVEMLCFTGASQYTQISNVGTTLGIVNTLNMLGGGLLQQAIGWVLDKVWSGKLDLHGLRYYTTTDYTVALSLLFAVIILCCILSFWLPKDHALYPNARQ